MPHDLSPESRVSLTALASELGVSVSTVWRWTLRGVRGHKLPCLHVGGRRYVTREAFANWLAATQAGAVAKVQQTCSAGDRESAIRCAEAELSQAGI